MSKNTTVERIEVQKVTYKLPEISQADYNKLHILFVIWATHKPGSMENDQLAVKLLTKEHAMGVLGISGDGYDLLVNELG